MSFMKLIIPDMLCMGERTLGGQGNTYLILLKSHLFHLRFSGIFDVILGDDLNCSLQGAGDALCF